VVADQLRSMGGPISSCEAIPEPDLLSVEDGSRERENPHAICFSASIHEAPEDRYGDYPVTNKDHR
jgi:hypothetical protein